MLILALVLFLPAFVLIVVLIQPRPLVKLIAWLNPGVVYFVPTRSKIVALTIDDGPHRLVTPLLLDVLKENSAKATFFLIGKNMIGNEDIIERIKKEGHEKANHLMEDYPSFLLPSLEFEKQLLATEKLISPAGKTKWLRPGSGWITPQLIRTAKKNGYSIALGSVYPHDTLIRNIAFLSWYVSGKLFPGAVIILHDGSPDRIRTVEVLRRILPMIRKQGYKIVTLSELALASNQENDLD